MLTPTRPAPPRVLLLASANSYRLPPFRRAAERLGAEVVKAMDVPPSMAHAAGARLAVDFHDPQTAAADIEAFASQWPLAAIVAADDSATLLAALAAERLGLPHNSPRAAEAARDKYTMRQAFAAAGVRCPAFRRYSIADDPAELARTVRYPCVVKPLHLSASRGVMRADSPDEFVRAAARLRQILETTGDDQFLVEEYIPGFEVALEGVLDRGRLKVLALFDKPDPLEGPFFEETLYVTPSRLPADVQAAIVRCAEDSARALGLSEGPAHAELRVNGAGPWILEIAGRSIGGLCSKTLRFGTDLSLEDLIMRQALGMPIESIQREGKAAGVMMIPIPQAGILVGVGGCEAAEAVPGIESVEIAARPYTSLRPLPEGDAYLGFIFARGESPEGVEAALREAHRRLRITIEPEIPIAIG